MPNSTSTRTELPVPDFFDPDNAGRWEYRPEEAKLLELAVGWRREHDIRPAAEDSSVVRLLLIDLQKDFCLPEGALYVAGPSGRGAVEDNERLAGFIYRNLDLLTEVVCTLDTHLPHQIFFPSFWLQENGRPPRAHREVTAADLAAGSIRPHPGLAAWLTGGDYDALRTHCSNYCRTLEAGGRYTLYLWPPHCLLGSQGHELAGIIQEARTFHSFARLAPNRIHIKGMNPLTEQYSALAPEVPGKTARAASGSGRWTPSAAPREHAASLLEVLLASDALIVAGQAASHCVKHTLDDLRQEIRRRDPTLAERVYVLQDCMSPVVVRDPAEPRRILADFTAQAQEMLERCTSEGMHLVRSEDPVADWPGFRRQAGALN
ncbi:MAG: nicotinamidase [Gemmatimonadota bacterium]